MKAVCAHCYRELALPEAKLLEATHGRHMTTVYCSDTFAFPAISLRNVEVACAHCGLGHAFAVDDEDAPSLRDSALASRED